jgi:hypothetical protein
MKKNPDVICALSGLFILSGTLVALWVRGMNPVYMIAVGIGVACILSYVILHSRISLMTQPENSSGVWLTAAVILLLLGILSFVFRVEQYVKPLVYYIAVSLASGAALIASSKIQTRTVFILVVILAGAIGLTHIWTEYMLFPGSLIGLDSWHHMSVVTQEMSANGSTEVPIGITTVGSSYSLMHLYLREILDITGLSYRIAALIFVGSPIVLGSIVLIGLISKQLAGYQVGAVAAIAVSSAGWVIFFGEWIIPNSAGSLLSLVAAYLVITPKIKNPVKWLALTITLVTAYFTHIIVAIWVIGTISCLSARPVIGMMQRMIHNRSPKKWPKLAGFIVPVITIPATLPTAGQSISHTTKGYNFDPADGMQTALSVSGTILDTAGRIAVTTAELTIASLGMLLYVGVAIFGILVIIRYNKYNSLSMWWVALSLSVLTIGFAPPLFGKSLLESRWWYFAEVLLAIPLAAALISLSRNKISMTVITIIFCLIVFLSTIGLPSNITCRVISPNLIVRYALTAQELEGLDFADELKDSVVGIDPIYMNALTNNESFQGTAVSISSCLLTRDFSNPKVDALLLRDAVYTEPFGFGNGTIYQLSYNIIEEAQNQGFVEIRHNDAIHLLIRSKR